MLLVSDIEKKLQTLVRVCDPILSKPPPKPQKPAAPQNGSEGKEQKEAAKETEGAAAGAAAGDTGDVDMDAEQNQQGDANMDVDS